MLFSFEVLFDCAWVVLHISEIFEARGIVTVDVGQFLLGNFKDVGEESKKW
jgi:hypothetical protein